jgi:hypothetical protein
VAASFWFPCAADRVGGAPDHRGWFVLDAQALYYPFWFFILCSVIFVEGAA